MAVYKYVLPQDSLEKAFSASGANLVSGQIHIYGTKYPKSITKADLKSIAKTLVKYTGQISPNTYNETSNSNDYISVEQISYENTLGYSTTIKVETQKDGNNTGAYASVTLDWVKNKTGYEQLSKDICKGFETCGIIPRPAVTITGAFSGNMETSEMNKVANKVFSSINAKKVEGMRDEKVISVSAWSPKIGQSITVNEKTINLNLAIRYNKLENRTYLWIATPVIKTEY